MYPRSSVSFNNCNLNLRNLDSPSPDLRSSRIILNLILIAACPSGHNFGSEHDPETTECAPSESDGGKFIMYPASVSGQWRNNKVHLPLYCVHTPEYIQSLKSVFDHRPSKLTIVRSYNYFFNLYVKVQCMNHDIFTADIYLL